MWSARRTSPQQSADSPPRTTADHSWQTQAPTAYQTCRHPSAATRARGYALEEEETVVGVACVAVPLIALGEPLAAVSVSVPVHRFPSRQRAALIAAMLESRPLAAASA